MNAFDAELSRRLDQLRDQGLYRALHRVDSPQATRIRIAGRDLLNFSSNDYLGLANDPLLKEAAAKAIDHWGAGAGASRLISGSLAPHHELEDALAHFKGAAAALAFSSGYATALGTITALLGKDDVIILDKLVHACIVDAARLSGAKLRVFAHNDLDDLERILRWTRSPARPAQPARRVLVATESVFSMDGDRAPLREIAELKDAHGAWLMVDEAHATGLYGTHRRGLAEEQDIADRIEIQMGTLGKALGTAGGYICGSRTLRDFLVNRARTFIFSTAPPPALAAAAVAAVQCVASDRGAGRCARLWQRVGQLASHLPNAPARPGAIVPVPAGEESRAIEMAAALRERDIFVPPIRYPTVARGQARLRVTLTAGHTEDDVGRLIAALGAIPAEV